jgi:uncharacterized protein (DUF2141 family)
MRIAFGVALAAAICVLGSRALDAGPIGVLSTSSDIDGDGDLDLTDFGILKANFGKTDGEPGQDGIPGDLDGNGRVDMTDFGILKDNFGKHGGLELPGIGVFDVPGDPSGDGKVDLTDFGMLKADFGKTTAPGSDTLATDINRDGRVDLTDFGLLKANFGKSAAATAVPAPASGALGLLALLFLAAARRLRCAGSSS